MKKIYIGSDHAGYQLKEKLKIYIKKLGYEIIDMGAFVLNNNDDYPDFVKPVAREISLNQNNFGIIIGGSGEGEAICANRFKNVRAIVYYGGKNYQKDINGKKLSLITGTRNHNNANILSLGARFLTELKAKKAVKSFLETEFSNDIRHINRLKKIDEIIN